MAKPCSHDSRPLYQQLIDPLRDVARKLGYAIGVHGTLKRDIDLIACPWTSSAVPARTLVRALQAKAREIVGYAELGRIEMNSCNPKWFRDGCAGYIKGHGRITKKPHGRRCWPIHLTPTQDGPYIDLSVMPRTAQDCPGPMIMRTAWIPEAPKFPGLYANESDRSRDGKASALQPSTTNPHRAKQFATEAECQAWCDANPTPIFVPKEHGFYE